MGASRSLPRTYLLLKGRGGGARGMLFLKRLQTCTPGLKEVKLSCARPLLLET